MRSKLHCPFVFAVFLAVVLGLAAPAIAQNTTCTTCPPGSFSDPAVCGDCPRGTCSVTCPVCPPGTAGLGGGYTCVTCCPGTFSIGNQTLCSPCRVGTGSGYGATSCCPCADGFFGSIVDPALCSREEASFSTGRSYPMSIAKLLSHKDAPSESDIENSVEMMYELETDYTDDFHQDNMRNENCTEYVESCIPCPKGTYRASSDRFCQNCGVGKYSDAVGASRSSTCLDCPDGKYCPFSATSTPLDCPKDHRCLSKSESPEVCSALDDSEPGKKDCENTPAFVLLILGIIFSIAVYISLIYLFWRQYRKKLAEERLSAHSTSQIYSGL